VFRLFFLFARFSSHSNTKKQHSNNFRKQKYEMRAQKITI
jgi:hypothetical protein